MFKTFQRREFLYAFGLAITPLMANSASADELKDGTFRREVVDIARKNYPGITIETGSDPTMMKLKETQIYLGNVYAATRTLTGNERSDALLEFVRAFALMSDKETNPAFAEARSKLRIQIAPTDFVERIPALLHRPLSAELVRAVVIDLQSTYRYVTQDDLKSWKISEGEALELGAVNLDAASSGVAIEVSSGPQGKGRFSLFDLNDGYAAARILCPLFMQRLHKALPGKIFLAIPNRDFLAVWTKDFGGRVRLAEIAIQQYEELDHPLTKELFVSQNGQIRLADSRERIANGLE